MERMAQESNYNVFVSGRICSGKTTFGRAYAEQFGYEMVDVSSIVREIVQSKDRTHNPDLDKEIIKRLKEILEENNGTIVVGVRQPQILKAVMDDEDTCIWLDIPTETLKERYYNRADAKDAKYDFETALQKDTDLGTDAVKDWMEKHCKYYLNYKPQQLENLFWL